MAWAAVFYLAVGATPQDRAEVIRAFQKTRGTLLARSFEPRTVRKDFSFRTAGVLHDEVLMAGPVKELEGLPV